MRCALAIDAVDAHAHAQDRLFSSASVPLAFFDKLSVRELQISLLAVVVFRSEMRLPLACHLSS